MQRSDTLIRMLKLVEHALPKGRDMKESMLNNVAFQVPCADTPSALPALVATDQRRVALACPNAAAFLESPTSIHFTHFLDVEKNLKLAKACKVDGQLKPMLDPLDIDMGNLFNRMQGLFKLRKGAAHPRKTFSINSAFMSEAFGAITKACPNCAAHVLPCVDETLYYPLVIAAHLGFCDYLELIAPVRLPESGRPKDILDALRNFD